jgi:hypothetical protein
MGFTVNAEDEDVSNNKFNNENIGFGIASTRAPPVDEGLYDHNRCLSVEIKTRPWW